MTDSKQIFWLVSLLLTASGCEGQKLEPQKVDKAEVVEAADNAGKPVSGAVLQRLFKEDICIVIEPARAPEALGLAPETPVWAKPITAGMGPRKTCRLTWDDEVRGPNFSIGFDPYLQGDEKEVGKQIDSMRRRKGRFVEVAIEGHAAFWDGPKKTFYWFPTKGNQLTLHMGQSKLEDPKAAAIKIVTTFLVEE